MGKLWAKIKIKRYSFCNFLHDCELGLFLSILFLRVGNLIVSHVALSSILKSWPPSGEKFLLEWKLLEGLYGWELKTFNKYSENQ